MNNMLDKLNERQKEAVLATEGPVLVLAGAGSGKTTVLVNRIAYMISEKHIRPWNILAITFTNKAAREMKDRIERLLVIPQKICGLVHFTRFASEFCVVALICLVTAVIL